MGNEYSRTALIEFLKNFYPNLEIDFTQFTCIKQFNDYFTLVDMFLPTSYQDALRLYLETLIEERIQKVTDRKSLFWFFRLAYRLKLDLSMNNWICLYNTAVRYSFPDISLAMLRFVALQRDEDDYIDRTSFGCDFFKHVCVFSLRKKISWQELGLEFTHPTSMQEISDFKKCYMHNKTVGKNKTLFAEVLQQYLP